MELITLYKPNGKKVQVNESSLDAATALGWVKTKPKAKSKQIAGE